MSGEKEYNMKVCVKGPACMSVCLSGCLSVCLSVSVLGVEPSSLFMLTKYCVTGTHPQLTVYIFFKKVTHGSYAGVIGPSARGFT